MGRSIGERTRRGPRSPRGEVAERILVAARDSFADNGYAGTTMQGVARRAEVDTKLVRYYFRDKAGLFDASLAFPADFVERIQTAVDVPLAQRGEAVIHAMLRAWDDPDTARLLRTTLLIAGHEPAAMSRVEAIYTNGLIPAVTHDLNPAEANVRGGLISSQMIGLAFARFVYVLPGATAISDHTLITHAGATIQRYLTEPLTPPNPATG